MNASLVLENGAVFTGKAIGEIGERVFELVFNTSCVGYQEILTDPAYAGQGIVMTYPLIGNYGVNSFDNESAQPWCEALVVRHLSDKGSNFRSEGNLNDYLKQHHIVGIEGVDTRAITRILREQGTMNGMITCAEFFSAQELAGMLKEYKIRRAVERVSRKETEVYPAEGEQRRKVAVMDLGVKNSELEGLRARGCQVTVFPAKTKAETILSGGFDGCVISGGPGDPAEETEMLEEVKKLYRSTLPLFGMGLGHQLVALAAGGKTRKLLYGHRGGNVPVRDQRSGRCFITSQNHGYEVDGTTLSEDVAQAVFVNVNDGGVEGLCYRRPGCFTVQFQPEFEMGAMKGAGLFDRFVESMGGGENA